MALQGLHHVAYRCRDAKETTAFYRDLLGLELDIAVAENKVPSTGEWSPHIHIFFKMGDGSYVAFFELPESPEMEMDQNTPDWVQHLALRVDSMAELEAIKTKVEAAGIEVIGPTDHKICQSIYFFDPNGHRMEVAVDTTTAEMMKMLNDRAEPVLDDWSKTKRAPDVDPMHA
ncbi:MAG: VOC family protein [Pseudomonadota bacterium]